MRFFFVSWSVLLALTLCWILPPPAIVVGEPKAESKATLEKDLARVEEQAIGVLREGFGSRADVRALEESYTESDLSRDKTTTFDAIAIFADMTLAPSLDKSDTRSNAALEKFKELARQHEVLKKKIYAIE